MLNVLIMIAGVAAVVLIWVMLYDSNRFIIVRHTFCDPRIKKTFRAVLLTDLHDKQYGKDNERLINSIKEQKPDAVFIAGDLLTADPRVNVERAVSFLEKLSGWVPIYYANGNHEHRINLYPKVYNETGEKYEEALKGMAIDRLINQHIDIPESGISVYGLEIEKEYYRRFTMTSMHDTYVEELLGKVKDQQFVVLLAHNPDYFLQYAGWGADLVLSGHIHGGIVRIPFGKGVLSPSVRFFPKYDGGVFVEGKTTMILSRGLGMHTIPFRLFNPGEMHVIDFKPKPDREAESNK